MALFQNLTEKNLNNLTVTDVTYIWIQERIWEQKFVEKIFLSNHNACDSVWQKSIVYLFLEVIKFMMMHFVTTGVKLFNDTFQVHIIVTVGCRSLMGRRSARIRSSKYLHRKYKLKLTRTHLGREHFPRGKMIVMRWLSWSIISLNWLSSVLFYLRGLKQSFLSIRWLCAFFSTLNYTLVNPCNSYMKFAIKKQ